MGSALACPDDAGTTVLIGLPPIAANYTELFFRILPRTRPPASPGDGQARTEAVRFRLLHQF